MSAAATLKSITPFLRHRLPRRTVLALDLEAGLVEHIPPHPVAQAMHRGASTVRGVVEALHRAAADRRVRGLLARIGAGELGLARIEEVRDAVIAFRAAGKPAFLFAETFGEGGPGNGGYYLGTAFDEVWLQPSGDLALTGVVVNMPFAKRALDRIGVAARLEQRHEYKSAMNHLTEEGFTEAHREAVTGVVEASYQRLVRAIAESRGVPEDQVRALIDRAPLSADEARQAGLVDRLGYADEVRETMVERVGGRAEPVELGTYLARAGRPFRKGPTVALIYGVGLVRRGQSGFHPMTGAAMGSDTVAGAFRAAVRDKRVRAIVFRIDSPGGSYVASDAVWREVGRAREAGKPVIATMGNVAASGGYFVAMAADRIIAQPSTITGSIGVVGGKVVTRDLWERLGINWEGILAGEHAAIWSTFRDYSPDEWRRVQASLDRIYQDFTDKVASARELDPAAVDGAARGRIWNGEAALRHGLVDELGGLPTALERAREAVGLAPDAPVRLTVFPRPVSPLRVLLGRARAEPEPFVPGGLGDVLAELAPLFRLAARLGAEASPGALRAPGLEWRP